MRKIYKPENVEIGKRIKAARLNAKITQEELAERIGITAQFASEVESGRMGASLDTICKTALALGVTSDSLLFGERPEHTEAARELEAMLAPLEPELLPLIMQALRAQIDIALRAKQIGENA